MATVIIFEDGSSELGLNEALNAAREAGAKDIRIIKDNLQSQMDSALENATETIVLANAKSNPSKQAFAAMLAHANKSTETAYSPVEGSEEQADLANLSPDRLVSEIGSAQAWPIAMISAPASILSNLSEYESTSAREYMAKALIMAASKNEAINSAGPSIKLNDSNSSTCSLSNGEQARALTMVVNSCNIEDLYPTHAWNDHEEESAAASFHSLAAMFIRLGDSTSALQCLSWSDRLEDSPRSLALKALIAREKGETLGAVANLVSSLQQYEKRKKNEDNRHYLTFMPENLDEVNQMLSAGLEALNKRDNDKAYGLFAKAVFSFDPFYRENGIARKAN